jgi:hypothetical protein
MKKGILAPRAFREKDRTLSWTYQNQTLQASSAIDDYQAYWQLEDGTRPGVYWLSHLALTELVEPPLEPRHAPDVANDPKYGDLHCTTDVPSKTQRDILAKIVNDGDEGAILRRVTPPPPTSLIS